MKNNSKQSVSQLFNFAQNSYLERSSRPVYAIMFLLPFIIFYGLGVIFIKTERLSESAVLVDAFVWLQKLLGYLGFSDKIAWLTPAMAVVLILTGLQLACRKRWRFYFADFLPMAVECILLAVPLIVFSLFLNSPATPRANSVRLDNSSVRFSASPTENSLQNTMLSADYTNEVIGCSSAAGQSEAGPSPDNRIIRRSVLVDTVAGIGAGIYEELVFRLILICVLMLLFQDVLRFEHKISIVFSVLISAALFSAHHHIDFITGRLNTSDPFNFTKFVFRALAGVYFAVLFAIRGFGITAGTHGFYNILAVFINAVFFHN